MNVGEYERCCRAGDRCWYIEKEPRVTEKEFSIYGETHTHTHTHGSCSFALKLFLQKSIINWNYCQINTSWIGRR